MKLKKKKPLGLKGKILMNKEFSSSFTTTLHNICTFLAWIFGFQLHQILNHSIGCSTQEMRPVPTYPKLEKRNQNFLSMIDVTNFVKNKNKKGTVILYPVEVSNVNPTVYFASSRAQLNLCSCSAELVP